MFPEICTSMFDRFQIIPHECSHNNFASQYRKRVAKSGITCCKLMGNGLQSWGLIGLCSKSQKPEFQLYGSGRRVRQQACSICKSHEFPGMSPCVCRGSWECTPLAGHGLTFLSTSYKISLRM